VPLRRAPRGCPAGGGAPGAGGPGPLRADASSAFLVLARVEPARGLADDLMPVSRHPQFEPGVPGILLVGRPHGQPVRAAVGADAGQVEGLRAVPGLGCRMVLGQHERGAVPAGELGPDLPGRLGDRGRWAGLGDHGQVAGLTTGRQPHPEVSNTLPGRADRVLPERFVGDQLTERRQAIRRGWRQDPSSFPQVSGRKRFQLACFYRTHVRSWPDGSRSLPGR
jgi:hypothetical protein